MSEKDRIDWTDDADFDSFADEPIEGFADFDDMDDFAEDAADLPPEDADTVSDLEESRRAASDGAGAPPPASVARRRGRGFSGAELGFLFTLSTLVGAAGVGSAVLLAVGIHPRTLWQPETFMAWENYLRPQDHPLNLLALIVVAVVLLTTLGSRAAARAAGQANDRTRAAEDMLDKVTALRLENETAWQDAGFKAHPAAAKFVSETLGAWRLQHARQRHFTGLEGELRRLEKALADNSRSDLTGRFDSPAVGTLADQFVRHFDEREALAREVAERRAGDEAEAAEIIQVVQDARCWNASAAGNVRSHGGAVSDLVEALKGLDGAPAGTADEAVAALAAVRSELDRVCAAAEAGDSGQKSDNVLAGLVDRGSKLAFQIAMEVSRLGPRGERLGPMSQALEDLTTDFRQWTDRKPAETREDDVAQGLERLAGRLADLEQQLRDSGGHDTAEQAARLAPAAAQLARNLDEIADSFGPQDERLTHLGGKFAEFSGASFAADDLTAGDPGNPPAGVLSLEGRMPSLGASPESIHQPADVDPFAVTPPAQADAPAQDPDFTTTSTTPSADIFGAGLDRGSLPELEIESTLSRNADLGTPPADEPALPDTGQKVYDLDAFGATPLDTPAPDATPEVAAEPVPEVPTAEIHDLAAFGAVPLDDPGPAAPAAASGDDRAPDNVYDLADFGAVRMDAPDGDEEIYDLNQFGAVPLN